MKFLMLGEKWWFRYPILIAVSLAFTILLFPFHDNNAVAGSFRDLLNHILTNFGLVIAITINIFWGEYLEETKTAEHVSVDNPS
jgi:hypothetical protein